jgi:predicted nuclease of predicted toxin-antitoxin system
LRLKLDENLSRHLKLAIESLGHEPRTAAEQGLLGKSDIDVAAAAREADEIVLTLAVGFGDLRKHPPGSHPGVILFRPRTMGPHVVNGLVSDFLRVTDLAHLRGCIVVVDPDRVRVRRPSDEVGGGNQRDS